MILYRSHPISYSSRQDRYAGRSACYYRIIKRINEENHTSMILIEQDTQRAIKASDAFCVMLKGKVVLSGKSSDIDPETLRKAYFGI